ncbi:transcription elongation factor NusA [Williamsoniiplasma somnilux]|uniref:Transcription termination/antitermination protein NusA n=1 Tax=Williamsoniiplasma somnilux TaxID=215578 RepID=A0A2K8NY76_9MOLU|nr:transcription termination factor NusA [Williamsoniiplasma somnilux]ATZ18694.1 transcription elongation factor NusA [Williamsoniiplasma somnilux]
MINGAELLEAISEIASEKKIDKEVIFNGIKEGFQKAHERFFDTEAKVQTVIDEQAGTIKMFQELVVTDQEVEDDWLEISLVDAQKEFGKSIEVGDTVKRELPFNDEFSRLAVYQVRQIIQQKIRGAERENVYAKFVAKTGEILSGKVTGMNEQGTSYLIDVEGTQASIWNQKIIPGEKFDINQFVSFYVEEVSKDAKFSQLSISRVAPNFLSKLVEEQVPEIADGIVEIKAVSREPGKRAKIAVYSHDQNVEPVGAVVGSNGSRIKAVTKELKGEQIDVIKYDTDFKQFLINAMAPVRVISVNIDEENNECDVIVPNEQLSLAIGKSGMAARLVVNLVKMRINIYSLENAKIDDLEILWNGNISESELNDPMFLENVSKRKAKKPFVPNQNRSVRRDNHFEIDNEALEKFQEEIRAKQAANAINVNDSDMLEIEEENDKEIVDLAEINANIEAFDELEEESQTEEDEEIIDEYDEYYEK